jgi:conjugal transfer pilus assembly protein TraA
MFITMNTLQARTMAMPTLGKKALVAGALLLIAGGVFAGTTGAEFLQLYNLVLGWATGYLGKVVAIAFLMVGAFAGLVRGSLMGAVSGIGMALVMAIGPGIIDGIVTATI